MGVITACGIGSEVEGARNPAPAQHPLSGNGLGQADRLPGQMAGCRCNGSVDPGGLFEGGRIMLSRAFSHMPPKARSELAEAQDAK